MSRVSRRVLLTSGAAAGVLAASGLPLRAQPVRGGVLRAALGGGTLGDTWDTRSHRGLFMKAAAHGAVFDTLTEVAGDGTLRGELATRWEAGPDARTWIFDLRRDARFHDGRPFGPDDVIASFALHRDAASPARPLVEDIADMRALPGRRLQIALRRGNVDFPYLLSDPRLVVYPAGRTAQAIRDGIGTGLYRVTRFLPGQRLQAKRVDDHYKSDGAGWFDAIDLRALALPQDRLAALNAGRADVVDLPLGWRGDGATRVQGNAFLAVAMDARRPPFDDARVRRAVKAAVDRAALRAAALGGAGVTGSDTPVGPLSPAVADIAADRQDITRARALLAAAGLPRMHLDLAVDPALGPAALAVAHALATQLAPAGIDATVTAPHAGAAPLTVIAWDGRATEDWALSAFCADSAPDAPWTGDAEFQNTLRAARGTLDPSRRAALHDHLQRRVADEGPLVVPAFLPFAHAASPGLRTPDALGTHWPLDNARFAERWWFG